VAISQVVAVVVPLGTVVLILDPLLVVQAEAVLVVVELVL
jgi:hypothetical protein